MPRRFALRVPRAAAYVCVGGLTLLATAPDGVAQGFTSNDLAKLRSVGNVALSPDGQRLAYTVVPGRQAASLYFCDPRRASRRSQWRSDGDHALPL